MMKLISILLFLFLTVGTIFAQSETSTNSPTLVFSEEKDIQTLKDKIATKVAELRQKNNKAVSGIVTEISAKTFKLKSENDIEYQVKLDDVLTKYYQIQGTSTKEIKQEDIKKSSYIVVSGVVNDKEIDANAIFNDEWYVLKSGNITEVDKVNFSIKVISNDKDTYTLDIEATTKQQILNIKTLEIEKTGFSKIKEGDTVHFVIKKTGEEKNNVFTAEKILILPQEYFIK
ncbi:MAG: hypothetical protein US11_C0001G0178 [Candidatus Roizmanbacteria bacterium GW2011_GWA2_36_23]|uniref:DUF5666 domain-containing protein n=1 Tax=Candidatus Roizmanbacteria bacterium GW2011_GWA2_36_23 TaxID=1618480 RepID=A0A0G0GR01_9BACT|nr:MAG: hypothetical protein US11_C0001G0178 [Candidatus Roizmanbacteria bacterium GW2011_GWA2_36_23]